MVSLLLTCLINIFDYKSAPIINTVLIIITAFIALLFNEFILFASLIFQDCVFQKRYKLACIFFIPPFSVIIEAIANSTNPFPTIDIPFSLLMLLSLGVYATCGLLSYTASKSLDLKQEIFSVTDNFDDNILLYKKERERLIDQQNYEVHIATLNERNRIAREIHDNVGHMLSRCILQVGALIAINKNESLNQPYQSLKNTLNEAMTNIRNSVHNLHEESMDLELALHKLFNEFTFCENEFEYDVTSTMDIEIRYSLIAITKEALNNVIKHSNATYVNLKLIEHPGFYQYIFTDNGPNSPNKSSGTGKSKSGIGLYNMEERVHQHNGTFTSFYNNGYCIRITIPK
jgi:signal transduction histidine kinase